MAPKTGLSAPRTAKGKAASRRTSLTNEAPPPASKVAKLPELAALEEDVGAAAKPVSTESAWSETPTLERKKAKAKSQPPGAASTEVTKIDRPPTRTGERAPTKGICVTQEMLDTQQEKITQLLADKSTSVSELTRMDEEVASLQVSLTKCEERLQELAETNKYRQVEIAESADQACNDARSNVDAANDRAQLAEDQLRELQRALWKAKARIHKAECLLEQMEEDDLLEFLDPDDFEERSEASYSDTAENPQEPQACLDQLISTLGVGHELEAPRPADPELIERARVAEEKAVEAEERAKSSDELTAELEAKVRAAQALAEEAEHRHQSLLDSALSLPDAIAEEDFSPSDSEGSYSSAGRRGSTRSEWHHTWSERASDEGITDAPEIKKTKSIPAKLGRLLSGGFL